ncbi:MAG: HU family DNA-binding protein [Desulfobacteraceae bacterium]|jgi:DNA-binding protein HU-beta|nr:MAG: HU family DNA-binding protein [Desulfobacteraceae bacterium]
MTKAELISAIAKSTGLTKADSERSLNAFLATAKATIKKKGRLPLAGFGTFVVVNRKARTGRNPQTGAPIQIKASKVVRFRPGKELKASL